MNEITLNQGQKVAADAFMEFLMSPDKEFIISGPAGVGKTYLMSHIIDNTMPRYHELCELMGIEPEYTAVVMTATTNKAAEVLSRSVSRPTSTVHSFFNLVLRDDYKTGQTQIFKSRNWEIHKNLIIFVDEASMIDTPLWKHLQEGTQNCKLVYVGDRYQLAPVLEDLSPVYKHNSPLVELLEPVRNAGQPALMALCQQLRDTVETGIFKPIQQVPGVIDQLDSEQMQDEIYNAFHHQTHDARILAFTNKRVVEYNSHIRGIRQLPTSFQPGELLVNNTVYHHKNGMVPVEMGLKVLRNQGPSQLILDTKHQVALDVEYLDLENSFGDILRHVPFATNRQHFDDLKRYYSRTKSWSQYFALKNNVADLRPRDAATVHKSQGSTYDTVFIDLGNISTCNVPDQVARMLYVAFSRARNRVFLYGNLAAKYGGAVLP